MLVGSRIIHHPSVVSVRLDSMEWSGRRINLVATITNNNLLHGTVTNNRISLPTPYNFHTTSMYLTRSEYDRGVNTFSPEGRLFQVCANGVGTR